MPGIAWRSIVLCWPIPARLGASWRPRARAWGRGAATAPRTVSAVEAGSLGTRILVQVLGPIDPDHAFILEPDGEVIHDLLPRPADLEEKHVIPPVRVERIGYHGCAEEKTDLALGHADFQPIDGLRLQIIALLHIHAVRHDGKVFHRAAAGEQGEGGGQQESIGVRHGHRCWRVRVRWAIIAESSILPRSCAWNRRNSGRSC